MQTFVDKKVILGMIDSVVMELNSAMESILSVENIDSGYVENITFAIGVVSALGDKIDAIDGTVGYERKTK